MRGTGRYWELIIIGAIVAAGALVFAQPLLLLGAIGVWVWLLIHQLRFVHYAAVVSESIQIRHVLTESVITTGETVTIRLVVESPHGVPCPVRLVSLPPLAATVPTSATRTGRLTTDEVQTEIAYDIEMEVAGQTAPRGVELQLRDSQGLFVHTWQQTDERCCPTLDVRPYGPRNIHVGSGRETIGRGYGEHETEHSGGGIEPLELREYVPGDSLSRIDWNATARLAEPYIREYEATADRQTLLVIDHRNEMGTGRAGRTMLAHARSVGLAVVATAQRVTDPLGWLTVGDDGLTNFVRPKSTPDQYQRAQQLIKTLEPTTDTSDEPALSDTETPTDEAPGFRSVDRSTTQQATTGISLVSSKAITVRDRRRIARSLSNDKSAFATQLRPFFAETTEYLHRISEQPLFQGTQLGCRRMSGTTWVVLLTSDRRPREVLETVRTARQDGNHVLVFLTPTVLFDTHDVDDLEAAYQRYRSFEQFRKRLDRYQRVSAFEVGPRDRLATILSGHQTDTNPHAQPNTPP